MNLDSQVHIPILVVNSSSSFLYAVSYHSSYLHTAAGVSFPAAPSEQIFNTTHSVNKRS